MSATAPPPLSALARAALADAQALGWSVFVEAADQRVRLGPAGHPGRDLVITLGAPAAERAAPDVPAPKRSL
jgi:hypothetical protein